MNEPQLLDCIVVGGAACGQLIRVRSDAEKFELRRPDGIKPLAASDQNTPEIRHASDVYDFHPLPLPDYHNSTAGIIGVAVVEGQTLNWALTQLITGFVENETNKLVAAGMLEKH